MMLLMLKIIVMMMIIMMMMVVMMMMVMHLYQCHIPFVTGESCLLYHMVADPWKMVLIQCKYCVCLCPVYNLCEFSPQPNHIHDFFFLSALPAVTS